MSRYLRLSSSFSSLVRPSKQIISPAVLRAIENVSRSYATQGSEGSASGPTRKQITVISDDGRLRWSELTGKEKVARATQQSFNFAIVLIGAVMTVSVVPFLFFFFLSDFSSILDSLIEGIIIGRCLYVSLPRRFLPRQQDAAVQQDGRPHQAGSAMHRTAWRRKADQCLRRRYME